MPRPSAIPPAAITGSFTASTICWASSAISVGELPSSRASTSSRVRRAVSSGDVELAQRLLGRPFDLDGRVVHGDHRGKELGFPTANVDLPYELAHPARGVYAGRARVGDVWYAAAGTRRLAAAEAVETGLTFQSFDVEVHLAGCEPKLTEGARQLREGCGNLGRLELLACSSADPRIHSRLASSLATMQSAFPTRPTPPPRQKPWTAAMTGTAHS